jgi:hypothetical protein
MTTLDKKQLLIKKIEAMPDELIDEVTQLVENVTHKSENEGTKSSFEQLLKETNLKYKKVWEALA